MKVISRGLLVTFLVNISFAYRPEAAVWEDRRKSIDVASLPSNFFPPISRSSFPNVSIGNPVSLGTSKTLDPRLQISGMTSQNNLPAGLLTHVNIRESFKGSASSTVVLLEDIHLNKEAQSHLSAAIKSFGDLKNNLPIQVGLEGAEGDLHFNEWTSQGDRAISDAVATAFFEKGKISGPAQAGLTSVGSRLQFWGVDNIALHSDNVQAYLDSKTQKPRAVKKLAELNATLQKEKEKTFSLELLGFDKDVQQYRQGKLSFAGFVQTLASTVATSKISFTVQTFLEALAMEKSLDFNLIGQQRIQVLEKLAKKMTETELNSLLQISLAYKEGSLTFADYFGRLRDICRVHGVDLKTVPQFQKYIQYVLLTDGIKSDVLFRDIAELEKAVYSDLSTQNSERSLVQRDRRLYLATQLVEFALTSDLWEEYSSYPNASIGDPVSLKPFEDFYRLADQRSQKMVENLDSRRSLPAAAGGNDGLAVLVAGGFHTEGITGLLKKKNISYIVASPKVTKGDFQNESHYLSVFDREKSSLDKIFSGQKLFLANIVTPGNSTDLNLARDVTSLALTNPDRPAEIKHRSLLGGEALVRGFVGPNVPRTWVDLLINQVDSTTQVDVAAGKQVTVEFLVNRWSLAQAWIKANIFEKFLPPSFNSIVLLLGSVALFQIVTGTHGVGEIGLVSAGLLFPGLILVKGTIRSLIQSIRSAVRKGLTGSSPPLKDARDTHAVMPTGAETGRYVSINWGGSNLTLSLVELKGRGQYEILQEMPKHAFSKEQINNPSAVFDFLAQRTAELLKKANVPLTEKIGVGFIFSFPMDQTSLSEGTLLRWVKGWKDNPEQRVIGKDVGSLLNTAFAANGLSNVSVQVLANDTLNPMIVDTYVRRGKNPQAIPAEIGSILGTGHNSAVLIDGKIYNLEIGGFDQVEGTQIRADRVLDQLTQDPPTGEHLFEKMVSGQYLPELLRLLIQQKIKKQKFNWARGGDFVQPYSLTGSDISRLAMDQTENLDEGIAVLAQHGALTTTWAERSQVRDLVLSLYERSAQLVAASFVALLSEIDPKIENPHVIAIEGSLYGKNLAYQKYLRTAMFEIVGKKADRIEIVTVDNAEGVGTAILAATRQAAQARKQSRYEEYFLETKLPLAKQSFESEAGRIRNSFQAHFNRSEGGKYYFGVKNGDLIQVVTHVDPTAKVLMLQIIDLRGLTTGTAYLMKHHGVFKWRIRLYQVNDARASQNAREFFADKLTFGVVGNYAPVISGRPLLQRFMASAFLVGLFASLPLALRAFGFDFSEGLQAAGIGILALSRIEPDDSIGTLQETPIGNQTIPGLSQLILKEVVRLRSVGKDHVEHTADGKMIIRASFARSESEAVTVIFTANTRTKTVSAKIYGRGELLAANILDELRHALHVAQPTAKPLRIGVLPWLVGISSGLFSFWIFTVIFPSSIYMNFPGFAAISPQGMGAGMAGVLGAWVGLRSLPTQFFRKLKLFHLSDSSPSGERGIVSKYFSKSLLLRPKDSLQKVNLFQVLEDVLGKNGVQKKQAALDYLKDSRLGRMFQNLNQVDLFVLEITLDGLHRKEFERELEFLIPVIDFAASEQVYVARLFEYGLIPNDFEPALFFSVIRDERLRGRMEYQILLNLLTKLAVATAQATHQPQFRERIVFSVPWEPQIGRHANANGLVISMEAAQTIMNFSRNRKDLLYVKPAWPLTIDFREGAGLPFLRRVSDMAQQGTDNQYTLINSPQSFLHLVFAMLQGFDSMMYSVRDDKRIVGLKQKRMIIHHMADQLARTILTIQMGHIHHQIDLLANKLTAIGGQELLIKDLMSVRGQIGPSMKILLQKIYRHIFFGEDLPASARWISDDIPFYSNLSRRLVEKSRRSYGAKLGFRVLIKSPSENLSGGAELDLSPRGTQAAINTLARAEKIVRTAHIKLKIKDGGLEKLALDSRMAEIVRAEKKELMLIEDLSKAAARIHARNKRKELSATIKSPLARKIILCGILLLVFSYFPSHSDFSVLAGSIAFTPLPEPEKEKKLNEVRSLAQNFDYKIRHRAKAILIQIARGVAEVWEKQIPALLELAKNTFDWHRGWIYKSRFYQAFQNHPIFVFSMEGRLSAAISSADKSKFKNEPTWGPDRLTTTQGGLGDLFGGWISALARLGFVTPLKSVTKAPEAFVFLPNYSMGTRQSKIDPWGVPVQESSIEAWSSIRAYRHGIPLITHPKDHSIPLTVQVPVPGMGLVNVQFRAIPFRGLKVIMMETDNNDTEAKRGILTKLYQSNPRTEERFRQQWVYSIAAQKFKEAFALPDGPIHLNESATFPVLIGRIEEYLKRYMELGIPFEKAYEQALELAGRETIFFTHTLEKAGLDIYYDSSVPLGTYIREYFSQYLPPEDAARVADWMMNGRNGFPAFFFQSPGEGLHISPINFILKLVYLYGGQTVAVSRLNSVEAGKFFSSSEYPVLTPEQVDRQPVKHVTNAVDEMYFQSEELQALMNLDEPEPSQRAPYQILNPHDPAVPQLLAELHETMPADYRAAGISDRDLQSLLSKGRLQAIEAVRQRVKEQYIRNITDLSSRMDEPSQNRLAQLKSQWNQWTGENFPESLEQMKSQDLKNLLDPNLLLTTWARRVVEYKRILFLMFGDKLPRLEELFREDSGWAGNVGMIDSVLDQLVRENHAGDLNGLLKNFVDLIVNHNLQFVFAGPTFDHNGRRMVATINRTIERLSKKDPLVSRRAVFMEGYNDEVSPILTNGSDMWLNTPERPREASGTSGMKGTAVPLSVLDGWAADGLYHGLNGLAIRPQSDLPLNHPKHWNAKDRMSGQGRQSEYFSAEADSLATELRNASKRFYTEASDWLNLVRRATYSKVVTYSVRSSFQGRHMPSADESVSSAGLEVGILELYEHAALRGEGTKKLFGMRKDLHFFDRHPGLEQLVDGGIRVTFRFKLDVLPLDEIEFFVTWGHGNEWRTVKITEITRVEDEYQGVVVVHPPQAGTYQLSVFASPADAQSNPILKDLRFPSGEHDHDFATIAYKPTPKQKPGGSRKRGGSAGTIVSFIILAALSTFIGSYFSSEMGLLMAGGVFVPVTPNGLKKMRASIARLNGTFLAALGRSKVSRETGYILYRIWTRFTGQIGKRRSSQWKAIAESPPFHIRLKSGEASDVFVRALLLDRKGREIETPGQDQELSALDLEIFNPKSGEGLALVHLNKSPATHNLGFSIWFNNHFSRETKREIYLRIWKMLAKDFIDFGKLGQTALVVRIPSSLTSQRESFSTFIMRMEKNFAIEFSKQHLVLNGFTVNPSADSISMMIRKKGEKKENPVKVHLQVTPDKHHLVVEVEGVAGKSVEGFTFAILGSLENLNLISFDAERGWPKIGGEPIQLVPKTDYSRTPGYYLYPSFVKKILTTGVLALGFSHLALASPSLAAFAERTSPYNSYAVSLLIAIPLTALFFYFGYLGWIAFKKDSPKNSLPADITPSLNVEKVVGQTLLVDSAMTAWRSVQGPKAGLLAAIIDTAPGAIPFLETIGRPVSAEGVDAQFTELASETNTGLRIRGVAFLLGILTLFDAKMIQANRKIIGSFPPLKPGIKNEVIVFHVGERGAEFVDTDLMNYLDLITKIQTYDKNVDRGIVLALHPGDDHSLEQSLKAIRNQPGAMLVKINPSMKNSGSGLYEYESILSVASDKLSSVRAVLNPNGGYGSSILVSVSHLPQWYAANSRLLAIWTVLTQIGGQWMSVGPDHLGSLLKAAEMAAKAA